MAGALPSTWLRDLDNPLELFEQTDSGYELYEEDDEFVLTIDMPGFERDEISVAWDDGVLNVAAEHTDERRGREKTHHQRFRFPKDVDTDAISATYTNGVLEVTLPLETDADAHGMEIPIEG